jgi:hypothetical protein
MHKSTDALGKDVPDGSDKIGCDSLPTKNKKLPHDRRGQGDSEPVLELVETDRYYNNATVPSFM